MTSIKSVRSSTRFSYRVSRDLRTLNSTSAKVKGYICLFLVIFFWVGQAEVTQSLQTDGGYNKPYLISWLNHVMAVLIIPIQFSLSKCRGLPEEITSIKKSDFSLRCSLLATVYLIADLVWYTGLAHTTVAVGTTLFNTSCVFTYILSVIFIGESLCIRKVSAVALALGGVAVFSFLGGTSGEDDDEDNSWWADMFIVVAAALYAVYEVLFKVYTERWNTTEIAPVNYIIGFISVLTAVLLWPGIWVVDSLPNSWSVFYEKFEWPDNSHLPGLLIGALGAVGFNVFFGLSLSLLSPVTVSVGCMLTIPVSAITDLIIHGTTFDGFGVLGALMIIASFILLNDDITEAVKNFYYSRRRGNNEGQYEEIESSMPNILLEEDRSRSQSQSRNQMRPA
eukprot:TRINITY_DN4090_c0_g1_i1.p1 TRINITY_DN4090_c0_g1~~TRINITY_DN4090_c0_g1_i1.p1  ORF type:complete len:394 (+),score=28.31 TRINITY_DN4090_c0_g1_i1:57-1238(+)